MQIRTLFHAATATAKWRSQLHWQERFKEAVHVRAVLVFDRAATENMYTHAHTNIFFCTVTNSPYSRASYLMRLQLLLWLSHSRSTRTHIFWTLPNHTRMVTTTMKLKRQRILFMSRRFALNALDDFFFQFHNLLRSRWNLETNWDVIWYGCYN